jgi:hypothetical protein
MMDKTRLEHDIERHEMVRTPLCVKLLIVILMAMLAATGPYIYKLRKEIKERDLRIITMKEAFKKEKAELLRRIRESSLTQGEETQSED